MKVLRSIIFKNYKFYSFVKQIKSFFSESSIKYCGGRAWIKKDVYGESNSISVGKNCVIETAYLRIHGNNNKFVIGNNVVIGKDCSFWMEGNDLSITIGDNVTMTSSVHLLCQECNNKIVIGSDCMFANHISIRTSDSHPIYDTVSNQRTNHAKDVIIGGHVWIAPQVDIMKGVTIGSNSIIGTKTIVTKDVPDSCLAVGVPAIVVKNNIEWTREHLF